MPYTRAYQLNIGDRPVKRRTMLNITPSSNWIQETFYSKDITVVEIETEFGPKNIECLPIERAKRSSLYQRIIDMQTRAELFRVTMVASNLIPNADTLEDFIDKANGDDVELDKIKKNWEIESINAITESSFTEIIDTVTEEAVYLRAEFFLNAGLESIRLTISSPELPTRGDSPVTAIYYSPFDESTVIDGGIKGEISLIAREPIPFTWTDKSGFVSTIVIFPNTVYEIQPVSVSIDYGITLLV